MQDCKQDNRTRKSQKLIYELIASRQRIEQSAVIESAKNFENMSPTEKKSLDCRIHCLSEINHAMDWFVDRILCDRRHK